MMNDLRYWSAGRYNLVIASIFIMLLIACSKEDDKPELDYSKVYLVRNIISDAHNHISFPGEVNYYYEYDTTGKIVYYKITPPDGYSGEEYSYQYISPSLIYKIHTLEFSIPDTTFLELNEIGLVITEHEPKNKFIRRIKYNDQGYRIYDKEVRYVTDTSDVTWTRETTYTIIDGNYDTPHYDDKVNTLGYVNFGMPFYGKSSKNLGKLSYSSDTFDGLQRLIKRQNNDFTNDYSYY